MLTIEDSKPQKEIDAPTADIDLQNERWCPNCNQPMIAIKCKLECSNKKCSYRITCSE